MLPGLKGAGMRLQKIDSHFETTHILIEGSL